jgi:hypothetical protein
MAIQYFNNNAAALGNEAPDTSGITSIAGWGVIARRIKW